MEQYQNLFLTFVILIPLLSSLYIKTTYSKYSKITNSKEKTGYDTAIEILYNNGIDNVQIAKSSGNLSDYYNPRKKIVALSNPESNSISAIAVSAHECGHAIQDKEGYFFLKLRNAIIPMVNISSNIGVILVFISLITELFQLFDIGILLMSLNIVFQLLTLPVEYNASRRAREQLISLGMNSSTEIEGCRKVLNAAALTYVASLLSSMIQILRLMSLRGRRK